MPWRGNTVDTLSPEALDRGQDPQLVVDENVVLRGIALLYVTERLILGMWISTWWRDVMRPLLCDPVLAPCSDALLLLTIVHSRSSRRVSRDNSRAR